MKEGLEIPHSLTHVDLGCPVPILDSSTGEYHVYGDQLTIDSDIDYDSRATVLLAARTLQRQSQRYWLLEFLRRRKDKNQKVTYDALILGCIDPERRQYAVYLYELGFECKYSTPLGSLRAGDIIPLKVTTVFPRSGQLILSRAL